MADVDSPEIYLYGEEEGEEFDAPGFMTKDELLNHLRQNHPQTLIESLRIHWDSVVLLKNEKARQVATGFLISRPPAQITWHEGKIVIKAFATARFPYFVITNAHVIGSDNIKDWRVRFFYDQPVAPAEEVWMALKGVVWTSPPTRDAAPLVDPRCLDFTVCEFDTTLPLHPRLPGALRGIHFEDSSRLVEREKDILMIGHPHGGPKKASIGSVISGPVSYTHLTLPTN